MYHFDWSIYRGEYGLALLQGFLVTLELAGWSLLFALCVGLVFGVLRWREFRFTEPICWLYVEFARNTPPLVQILFWYFSASVILPDWLFERMRDVGYEFSAAVVALTMYHGAFIAEVIRAGLRSVHRGQYEGAQALGLSFLQRMRYVILPQAIRILIPPLTNESVSLVKNTSLALAVGVTELTYQAKYIDSYTFRTVEALAAATVLYLFLCLGIGWLGRLLNARLSRHVRQRVLAREPLTSEG
jgi:polar amino acid transport system permease protein